MKQTLILLKQNSPQPIKPPVDIRLIRNKEIINSLQVLRRNIKSKDYDKRMNILLDKSQELTRLGLFIKDPKTRISNIALRLLEDQNPLLKNKPKIEEIDWEDQRLTFNSVIPIPQKRQDKAPAIWEQIAMRVNRISDKRGVDNKIVVKIPKTDTEIKTPWYAIPNVVDFEISDKLGYNAALLLIQQQLSRAKAKESYIPWTGFKPKG